MKPQFRKGDPVIVVEGAHQGLQGTVLDRYRAHRDGITTWFVKIGAAIDNGHVEPEPIEIREAFVRPEGPQASETQQVISETGVKQQYTVNVLYQKQMLSIPVKATSSVAAIHAAREQLFFEVEETPF